VYDRIAIAHSQGLAAGPHGTLPPRFPVFSKPIVNLKGMGLGTRLVRSLGGNARWWRHVTGRPAGGGTFDYWTVHADAEPALEASLGRWIAAHLPDYSGMVNIVNCWNLEVGLAARDRLRGWFPRALRARSIVAASGVLSSPDGLRSN
jgi:hypothetical protein